MNRRAQEIPEGNDDCVTSTDIVQDKDGRQNRRKAFSMVGLLERVLEEADKGNFPISYRRRDCERGNIFPMSLNAAHARGDLDEIKKIKCGILKALFFMDRTG